MRCRRIAAFVILAGAIFCTTFWAQDPPSNSSPLGLTVRPRKHRRVVSGSSGATLPTPPQYIMDFLGAAASALAEGHRLPFDADPFLDTFDSAMPGYAALSGDVRGLLAEAGVASFIEPLTDVGDDRKRTLELDWILEMHGYPMRRKIVTITLEKRQKDWKFTSFDPIDFFKPPF
jgi:hypothetical protein